MGCKNLGPELMMKDFGDNSPQGNTYEITISPCDKLIVKVQHPELPQMQTVNEISTLGMRKEITDTGRAKLVTDFSIKEVDKY